jgi:hypothetical protein
MSGIEYTYDELCAAVLAEPLPWPPETWRGGEFDLNDYLIEAMQVGIIGTVDVDGEDGYSEPEAAEPGA